MPLQLRYVDEIHARLMVRYGSAWTAKWAGFDETLMQAVKADWADQLDGMSPASIRKALDSLPADFPPTATAFRALGQTRDEAAPAPLALPAPDPAGMRRVAGALKNAVVPQKSIAQHAEECFADLRQLEREGRLTPAQRDFLDRSNYGHTDTVQSIGEFTAVPDVLLPPEMRKTPPAEPMEEAA